MKNSFKKKHRVSLVALCLVCLVTACTSKVKTEEKKHIDFFVTNVYLFDDIKSYVLNNYRHINDSLGFYKRFRFIDCDISFKNEICDPRVSEKLKKINAYDVILEKNAYCDVDGFNHLKIQIRTPSKSHAAYFYFDECCNKMNDYESPNVKSISLNSCWELFIEKN